MNQDKRILQSGRTMLETISVLSVMAVLSVLSLQWFGDATARAEANDLMNEVRKRALSVSSEKKHTTSAWTEGIFDKANTGGSGLTASGYLVGDNQQKNNFKVTEDTIDGYKVVYVPVGESGGTGKPLSVSVCKELLRRKVAKDQASAGAIVSVESTKEMESSDCTGKVKVIKIGILEYKS